MHIMALRQFLWTNMILIIHNLTRRTYTMVTKYKSTHKSVIQKEIFTIKFNMNLTRPNQKE